MSSDKTKAKNREVHAGRDKPSTEKDKNEGNPSGPKRSTPKYADLFPIGPSSQRVVDSETYAAEAQSRTWKALKRGVKFETSTARSDKFLRQHVNSKVGLIVLYADLVGSTKMTRALPVARLATILQTFTQEMSFMVSNFDGYVLKYVGDAVIAYFPVEANFYLACDAAVNCASSMITILRDGINPVLHQYDYPDLAVKVGIDAGEHAVIQYGTGERSHVDILGYAISMAAKITSHAAPNQTLLSHNVYSGMHPSLRKRFSELEMDRSSWNYTDENTGEIYRIYALGV